MAEPAISFPLQNQKVTTAIVDYATKAQEYLYGHFLLRDRLEELDRAYQREEDTSLEHVQAKNANRSSGDKTKRDNIIVPIVMPQVESALGYFSEVFLSGYPIFPVGGPVEWDEAALMMETIVGENSITAAWPRHLMMFFRDGFKYNLQAMEVVWDRKTTAAFETDPQFANGKQGKPKEVVWEGNCMQGWISTIPSLIHESRPRRYTLEENSQDILEFSLELSLNGTLIISMEEFPPLLQSELLRAAAMMLEQEAIKISDSIYRKSTQMRLLNAHP
jgi:hypothetical protein